MNYIFWFDRVYTEAEYQFEKHFSMKPWHFAGRKMILKFYMKCADALLPQRENSRL